MDEEDVETFTNTIKEFDSMTRLVCFAYASDKISVLYNLGLTDVKQDSYSRFWSL